MSNNSDLRDEHLELIRIIKKIFIDVPIHFLVFDNKGFILEMNEKLRNSLKLDKKKNISSFHLKDIVFSNQNSFFKYENPRQLIYFSYTSTNEKTIPVEGFWIPIADVIPECNNLKILISYDIQKRQDLQKQLRSSKERFDKMILNHPELRLWSITQKKEPLELIDKSVRELQLSERRYQDIVENIREGYFELDLDGKIIFINNGFCTITGFSKSDIIGEDYKVFLKEGIRKVTKSVEDGLGEDTYELKLIKKNHKVIMVESSLEVKKNSQGEKVGYFGLLRDITERKKAQEMERKFRAELEEKVDERTIELKDAIKTQKKFMTELIKTSHFKSKFLATFSHELRTPLNVIIGFTDLLLEKKYDNFTKRQEEYLLDIKEASEHLLEMIKDILQISKIESGRKQVNKKQINLKLLINQLQSQLTSLIEKKNIDFTFQIENSIRNISSDPVILREILFNVLSNAIKFTLEGRVSLTVSENRKYWNFLIEDTGIGIAEEDFPLIFQEFKRVINEKTENIEGTGLGLPITKNLVNLLGGSISFTSKLNEGTKFIIMILKS